MQKLANSLALALVAGCFVACSGEPVCDYDDEPYMEASSAPPLRAPEGLATPDRTSTLVIPPTPPGAASKPSGKGRCLDRPPSYFQTAPGQSGAPQPGAKEGAESKPKP